MMITALLAAWTAVNFPGGDVADLARSIAEATKQNVVFQAGGGEVSKGFEYPVEDLNEMTKAILAGSGFKRAPGAEQVFHHGRVATWNFGLPAVQQVVNDEPWRAAVAWPSDALQNGKVTLRATPGQAFAIDALPREFLPKPLEVHWFLQGLAVKPWVADLSAPDFVAYLAKSVGGKFLQKSDRFVIDLDGGEIQRRVLATITEVKKSPKYSQTSPRDRGQLELARSVLAGLGPAQMTALLSLPSGVLRFAISGTTRPAVQNYIQALMQPQDLSAQQPAADAQDAQQQGRRGQRGQNRQPNVGLLLRRADPRILGYTSIDAKFNVRVELLTLDNFGRPGRLVTLP